MKKVEKYISDCGGFSIESGRLSLGAFLTPCDNEDDLTLLLKFLQEYKSTLTEHRTPLKEKRFIDIIANLREIECDYWVDENDRWLIDKRALIGASGVVLVSKEMIWDVFSNEFEMRYSEVYDFIRDMLFKYFGIEGLCPSSK